ncbi:MAG: hypothetical protein Fur0025_47510 [Oscillatoriaceae cyanobacterium]
MIFSRILLLGVAAAATSVVTMVPARSARAQVVSPVSPTVVNPTSPGTPSIGGTSLSETTTTETTTTTGETTTTTTTTVTETTTTTTNTETEVGVEATTNVVDDTATTAVPPEAVELEVVQEAAPQNTGEIMTTATDTSIPAAAPTQETPTPQPPPAAEAPQQQAPQQQAAATSTVVEQFIFGTTMLLSRLGGLSSLSIRRGLVGVRFARITVTQYVVYQGLGVRFNGFPRERKK